MNYSRICYCVCSLQFSAPDDIGMIAVAGRQTKGKGNSIKKFLPDVLVNGL